MDVVGVSTATAARVLVVPTSVDEVRSIRAALRDAGLTVDARIVSEEPAYLAMLASGVDLVVASDDARALPAARALRLLRDHSPHTPIIILCARARAEAMVELMKAGATDCLSKARRATLGAVARDAIEQARRADTARAADEAERAAGRLCRELLDHLPAFVWMADGESRRLLYASPAGQAIWGRPLAWDHDRPDRCLEDIHPDDRERMMNAVHDWRDAQSDAEYRVLRTNGPRWMRTRTVRIETADIASLIVGITEDTTEQKQAEQTRDASLLRWAEMEKRAAIDALAVVVAHDLDQALGVIEGSVRRALFSRPTAAGAKHLRTALETIERDARQTQRRLWSSGQLAADRALASPEPTAQAFAQIVPPPAGPAEASSAAAPTASTAESPLAIAVGRGETVLLVDDHEGHREAAKAILEACHYVVVSANSVEQAIDLWERHADRINLVVTDIAIGGGISGIALGSRLEASRPGVRLLFMSGAHGDRLTPDPYFLRKPYTIHSLTHAVRAALDN